MLTTMQQKLTLTSRIPIINTLPKCFSFKFYPFVVRFCMCLLFLHILYWHFLSNLISHDCFYCFINFTHLDIYSLWIKLVNVTGWLFIHKGTGEWVDEFHPTLKYLVKKKTRIPLLQTEHHIQRYQYYELYWRGVTNLMRTSSYSQVNFLF